MAAMARDLLARGHASAMLWVLEANSPPAASMTRSAARRSPDASSSATGSARSASRMGGTT